MSTLFFVVLVLAPVIGAVEFLKWRRRVREQKLQSADPSPQLHSTQENIARRLRRAVQREWLVASLSKYDGGYHICVTRAGVLPPDDLVMGIFVNLINPNSQGSIYVRYLPSMAAGWFGSEESNLLDLIRTLNQYLDTQVEATV